MNTLVMNTELEHGHISIWFVHPKYIQTKIVIVDCRDLSIYIGIRSGLKQSNATHCLWEKNW